MTSLLELLALSGLPLDPLVDGLPPTEVSHTMVYCPIEAKGKVMRHLIEASARHDVQLVDGVKVRHGGGPTACGGRTGGG